MSSMSTNTNKRKSAWDVAQSYKKPKPKPSAYVSRRSIVPYKEDGFVDLASAAYNMDTTGTVTLIPTVPQGASVSQRVGKKILWKSMQIRGGVYAQSAAVIPTGAWMIVYDRRPTGSTPAVTDILVSASQSSFTNDANAGRFKILMRRDYQFIGPGNAGTSSDPADVVNEYLKLKNLPCVFKAAGTGAIADIEEGALYLVTVGSNASGANAACTAGLAFRTRYIDV